MCLICSAFILSFVHSKICDEPIINKMNTVSIFWQSLHCICLYMAGLCKKLRSYSWFKWIYCSALITCSKAQPIILENMMLACIWFLIFCCNEPQLRKWLPFHCCTAQCNATFVLHTQCHLTHCQELHAAICCVEHITLQCLLPITLLLLDLLNTDCTEKYCNFLIALWRLLHCLLHSCLNTR